MTDQAKALLALAYGAVPDEPLPTELLALIARLDGCTCGGWGVTDGITYDREPCGPNCIYLDQLTGGSECPKESHESSSSTSKQN